MERLDAPAVLIHGPPQCGKSTLAQSVGGPLGYASLTFDDDAVRRSALTDPVGFADRLPGRCMLDEIQPVPDLFRARKRVIDRDRTAGRFVLAGSTNILLLPEVADSLAGRLEIIRLHALAAGQTARLLNVSDQAAPFQVSRPTIRDDFTLLARVWLLEALPPWHSNRLSRLLETPKLHLGDTGVASARLDVTAEDLRADRPLLGPLLATFVVQELRRLASTSPTSVGCANCRRPAALRFAAVRCSTTVSGHCRSAIDRPPFH